MYNYALTQPIFWTINEPKKSYLELNFHIEKGDYFLTLATIIGLLQDKYESIVDIDNQDDMSYVSVMRDVQDELKYLNKNFKIARKIN